jgi:hypothetical protein
MSCCGKSRVQPFILPNIATKLPGSITRPSGSIAARTGTGGSSTFQYIGKTRLTVIGPVTRRRYDFDRSGVRVSVDPLDGNSLATVPTLKRV